MNYKMLGKLLGWVLLLEAGLMLLPMLVALIYKESPLPYLITVGILLLVALPTRLLKPKTKRIYAKDGFITVALSWILLSVFGALPFVISGAIPNYIDALFETVSGFTTTGASIIPVGMIEALPKGILFLRSFTHWIGGMGILVFMLALMPNADGDVIFLMRAEVPGPSKGKLVPKLKDSSLILYLIYLALTLLEIIALLFTRMPLYDAIVNAFGTMGTGGFSVLNDSIAGYNNPAAEIVIAIFLFLAGINYNIYFYALIKKFRLIGKNDEFRTYILITGGATAIITINLIRKACLGFGESLRLAFFQVTSIISTAGFTTASFDAWPYLSQTIILILMLIGASAGSTAGGFKISRVIILFKNMKREIRKIFKPNSVKTLRLDGSALSEETVRSTGTYLTFYTSIIIISIILLSFDGKDILTTVTTVIACFNNIGPAFGEAFATYATFSMPAKLLLTFIMLFGRLEIMPMLVLLSPSSWRRN